MILSEFIFLKDTIDCVGWGATEEKVTMEESLSLVGCYQMLEINTKWDKSV